MLSGLPSELEQLAILFVELIQNHHTGASMVTVLKEHMRLDDTPDTVHGLLATADLKISATLSNPFETLRKLAAVWKAVDDLASGFVERSINFVQDCKTAQAAGLESEHYELGYKFRPLSHLWDREVTLDGSAGHQDEDKPQPWSLPLRASEIHRVKRVLWPLEIFAALSHEPHTLPKESAAESEGAEICRADAIETWNMPQDYLEGSRILLASLLGSELAGLDSVYDYLWCETIGKAYQHRIDACIAHYDEKVRQARAEGKAGTASHDTELWEHSHADFLTRLARKGEIDRATEDADQYLKYFMSFGLPFLHRVHQQTVVRSYRAIILCHDTAPPLDLETCASAWPGTKLLMCGPHTRKGYSTLILGHTPGA